VLSCPSCPEKLSISRARNLPIQYALTYPPQPPLCYASHTARRSGLKQRSVSSFNRFSPGKKKLGGASKRMRAQGAPQFCLQNPG
jgi:hypothetical protein